MMGAAADLCLLKRLGRDLNSSPDKSSLTAAINGTLTIQDLLIETLLKVRSKTRGLVLLTPNRAQQEYGRKCGQRNVVLKARQLGGHDLCSRPIFYQDHYSAGHSDSAGG